MTDHDCDDEDCQRCHHLAPLRIAESHANGHADGFREGVKLADDKAHLRGFYEGLREASKRDEGTDMQTAYAWLLLAYGKTTEQPVKSAIQNALDALGFELDEALVPRQDD